jgi:SAM-dependent methyltransferase
LVSGYHKSRLTPDFRRDIVWQALWQYYFRHLVPADGCVLDLGCGYGNFINHVVARRRIAIDLWSEFPKFIAPGVETVVGGVTDLDFVQDGAVDFAFASNLFEHIPQTEFSRTLDALRRKLSSRGTLTILQTQLSLCLPGILRRLHPYRCLLACQPHRFPDGTRI